MSISANPMCAGTSYLLLVSAFSYIFRASSVRPTLRYTDARRLIVGLCIGAASTAISKYLIASSVRPNLL